MTRLLSVDSKPAQFLSRIWDLFLLNILFLLGALPVVTLGVSAIAAYAIMLKIVEDRDEGIVLAYFRAFKANLRQGLILTVSFFVLAAAVATDFILFEIVEGSPIGFLILGIVCAALVFVHFFYVWALAARYHNSLYRHLTNSRSIFIRFFGRSMLCTVLTALVLWLFFFNDWLLLFIGVFIAPILIFAIKSTFAMKIFRIIEAENAAGSIGDCEPDEDGANPQT